MGLISIPPQGRLTLSSTSPVMTSDVAAATTIYYLPYVGRMCPVYNGTQFNYYDMGSSGISLSLSTTNHVAGSVYDVFAFLHNGR